MSELTAAPPDLTEQTPLKKHLGKSGANLPASPYRGALTTPAFTTPGEEFKALTTHAAAHDLGYRAPVRITGEDRIRWTNGMVSNTIVGLEQGSSNYSFLLNAQGRILGDATITRFADHLLLETDRSQLAAILAHLDHFIIMDDVELQPLDACTTAIGIAGPDAAAILGQLGLATPSENTTALAKWQSNEVAVIHAYSPVIPKYEISLSAAAAPALWNALLAAGAAPAGSQSIEALRILEAIPLYGVDILDKHLPQETAQARALSFTKGCYLGQEIVERIRSRATVHRTFRQFQLASAPAPLERGQTLPIEAEGAQQNPVGQLSSIASCALPSFTGVLALGFIRAEALERKQPLTAAGIQLTALEHPPQYLVPRGT